MEFEICFLALIYISYFTIVRAVIPYGCECEDRNVDINDCVKFDCKCICDLTAEFCDRNCYCDPDCSDDDKSSFMDRLPEIKPRKYLPLCSQLDYNSEDPFQILFNAMCITRNNNPSKGQYYVSRKYPDIPEATPEYPITKFEPNSVVEIMSGEEFVKLPVSSPSFKCDFYLFKFLNSESNDVKNCYLRVKDQYLNESFYTLIPEKTEFNVETHVYNFADDTNIENNVVNKVVYNFTVRNNESNFYIDLLNISINVIDNLDPEVLVDHSVIYTLVDDSAVNTTQLQQQKSGNPGYINGLPIITNLGYLSLPSPGTDGCNLSHDLLFNENYFTICSITIDDVTEYALDYTTVLENYTTTDETMVARYGNSDFNTSINEFVNITIERPENISVPSVYCVIVQGIHYEFLTTSSGRHGNPQNTIFGSRLRFSSIQVPCEGKYELQLEVSATFMYINEKKLSNYLSRLPNLILDLIYTWFEPFFYKSYDPNMI